MECAIFGHEGVSDTELLGRNIDPVDWKRLAVDALFAANRLPTSGSLYEWQTSVGANLDSVLSAFCNDRSLNFKPGKLKPKKNAGWDKLSELHIPMGTAAPPSHDSPVTTVHAVKGETHDLTLFVCPGSSDEDGCLSTLWWSSNEKHREERRIAYVAMTRTRGDLIVWVTEETFTRLKNKRAAFVGAFDCMNIEEVVLAFSRDA